MGAAGNRIIICAILLRHDTTTTHHGAWPGPLLLFTRLLGCQQVIGIMHGSASNKVVQMESGISSSARDGCDRMLLVGICSTGGPAFAWCPIIHRVPCRLIFEGHSISATCKAINHVVSASSHAFPYLTLLVHTYYTYSDIVYIVLGSLPLYPTAFSRKAVLDVYRQYFVAPDLPVADFFTQSSPCRAAGNGPSRAWIPRTDCGEIALITVHEVRENGAYHV